MPVLANSRHERFAQELAKGSAINAAYAEAGYTPSDQCASRLARNAKIVDRIEELKAKAAIKCELTIADLVAELEEARTLAKEVAQPASLVTATMGKAKLLGLVVDKAAFTGDIAITGIKRTVVDGA